MEGVKKTNKQTDNYCVSLIISKLRKEAVESLCEVGEEHLVCYRQLRGPRQVDFREHRKSSPRKQRDSAKTEPGIVGTLSKRLTNEPMLVC